MNKIFFLLIFLAGILTGFPLLAQKVKNRIEPGKMYYAGDSLYAPRYGFTSKVPQGWNGTLPRETEIFLLNSATGTFGEIFVFGRKTIDLKVLAEQWKSGVDITETLRLRAENPQIEGDMLFGEAKAVGNYVKNNYRAFAAIRCGNEGACVSVLAISAQNNFEEVSKAAKEFLQTATLDTPRELDPYEGFDWQEFLSGKLLIAYEDFIGGKQETKIHLCTGGTFQANIKKKGMMKENNEGYKGNISGNWIVEGNNPEAKVTFTFSKKDLNPITIQLNFVEEQLYANGMRHYASQSEKCQ